MCVVHTYWWDLTAANIVSTHSLCVLRYQLSLLENIKSEFARMDFALNDKQQSYGVCIEKSTHVIFIYTFKRFSFFILFQRTVNWFFVHFFFCSQNYFCFIFARRCKNVFFLTFESSIRHVKKIQFPSEWTSWLTENTIKMWKIKILFIGCWWRTFTCMWQNLHW